MKLSDKIIKDESLRNYAKKLDPVYYEDHFNSAWLIFRTKEVEEKDFTNRVKNNYRGYFVKIIRSQFINSVRTEKHYSTNRLPEIPINDVDYSKIEDWFNSEGLNEEETVLKNIIEIVSKTNTKTEAINLTGIPRCNFYEVFNEALIKLKKECIY